MAFDAGSIEAELRIRLEQFNRDIDAAEARVREFENRPHNVPLHARLTGVPEAETTLDQVSRERDVKMRISPQETSRLRADVAKADEQLAADVKQRAGSGRGVLGLLLGIGGGGGAGGGSNLLRGLGGTAGEASGALDIGRIAKSPAGLLAGANVATGLGEPLVTGAIAGGAGLAGAGAAAGLGAGIFGLTAKSAIAPVTTALQAQGQAQQQLASAQTPAQRTAALHAEAAATADLTKQQRQMLGALQGADAEWQKFVKLNTPAVAKVLTEGLALLPPILRIMQPFIQPIATALRALIEEMRGAIAPGTQFSKIMKDFATASGPALQLILRTVGHLFEGFLGILHAFLPTGINLLVWLDQSTAKFATWGQTLESHKGFQTLMAQLKSETPLAISVIGNLVTVLYNFARALAGTTTVGNSKALLQFLVQISPLLVSMSKNMAVDRIIIYGLAIRSLLKQMSPLLQATTDAARGTANFVRGFSNAESAASKATGAVGTFGGIVRQVGGWLVTGATAAAQFAAKYIVMAAQFVARGVVIIASYVAQAAAATAAFIAENAATLGIIAGIAILVGAIIYLATHWKQVWNDIKNWARDAWNFLTHGWGQYIIPGLTLIRLAVEFFRDHWRQAWDAIKKVGQDFWNWIWTDFGAKIVNFMTHTVPQAFQTAVANVKRWWDDIKAVVKDPIHFVVYTVLDGLIDAFDWVTSKIGLGKPIPRIQVAGLARGGHIDGYGGGDRHPALLESGETVVSKEHSSLPFMEAAFRMAGVPGYQAGGSPGGGGVAGRLAGPGGGPTHSTAHEGGNLGFLSKAADIGKIMAALATGNTTALTNAFNALFGHGVGGATAELGQILTKIPEDLVTDAVGWLISHFAPPGGSGGGGGNVEAYRAIVQRVLAMLGLPGSYVGFVLNQMKSESGGNQNAVNRTDINWQEGHPSVGLMQVIAGTFRAFAGPFAGTGPFLYGVSTNPLANIYAAVNYGKHGAGFGTGAGQIGSMHGYDGGGWLEPGVTLAVNRTGQREAVLNPAQSDQLAALSEGSVAEMTAVLRELVQVSRQAPVHTAGAFGDVLNGVARGSAYQSMYSTRRW